ncbi:hypothetical protein [Brevibacillus sp. H7]
MLLILTETTCKICKAKLTEYEIKHKDGLCMECHKEEELAGRKKEE